MFPLILTVFIGIIIGDSRILLRADSIRGEHPKARVVRGPGSGARASLRV